MTGTERPPSGRGSGRWTVVGETGASDGGDDAVPRLGLAEIAAVTGWTPKPEGWCRGDECIPAALLGDSAVQDPLEATVVAERLHAAFAIDEAHRVAVIGHRHDPGSTVRSGVAPDVVLTEVGGGDRGLFDERYDKTLLVVFSSWCGCRYDLPGWRALRDELAAHDFGVVAVAIDESTDAVEPWAEGLDLPVLVDTDRRFVDAYDLVNVPTVIWIDREHRVVRPPSTEFSDDQFTSVHGVESGPHLDAVRRWVLDGDLPEPGSAAAIPAPSTAMSDDQARARAEFRLALELKRRGHNDAAAAHVATADTLAPDDFTIWRAGMQLVGDDPFGAAFFDRYLDWQHRTGNGPSHNDPSHNGPSGDGDGDGDGAP